jgi:hypothetical protein
MLKHFKQADKLLLNVIELTVSPCNNMSKLHKLKISHIVTNNFPAFKLYQTATLLSESNGPSTKEIKK